MRPAPIDATSYAALINPARIRTSASLPGKTRVSTASDAKSDALSADSAILAHPDLARLVAAWPNLPEKLKAQLLKLADQSFFAR
jgi:hypothetical protein